MEHILLRTNAAIQDCERHLEATGTYGTEIESYLTQYLLVILCVDVQQEIYRLAENSASTVSDAGLAFFVAASARKIFRSVSKKEIANFIEMFGTECKQKLSAQIDDAEVTIYSNAVSSRHEVAHNAGILVSFRELKEATAVAGKLLTAAAQSLS
jgi:uncharacterized protein (UPF0332 family)